MWFVGVVGFVLEEAGGKRKEKGKEREVCFANGVRWYVYVYVDGAGVGWRCAWGLPAPCSDFHSHSDFGFIFEGCHDRDSGKQQG